MARIKVHVTVYIDDETAGHSHPRSTIVTEGVELVVVEPKEAAEKVWLAGEQLLAVVGKRLAATYAREEGQ